MSKNTELRKLPAGFLSFVEEVLDEDWKRFMTLIPKNLEDLSKKEYESKYNSEHIRLIENYANQTNVKCAKVLFVEWGTSGRVRPTLETLQTLLVNAQIFKAADAIANMLGEPLPDRPDYGPGAPVDINITHLLNEDSETQQINTTTNNYCNNNIKHLESSNLMKFPTTQVDLGPQSTEQILASDMIKFSKALPTIQVDFGPQSAEQISASEMIKFSNATSNSKFLPRFDILNPKTNASSTLMASTSDSETLISHSHASQSSQSQSNSFQTSSFYEQIDVDIREDTNLIQFPFKWLEEITNNFTDTIIGSGGFGDVFLGIHDGLGMLAVKKAHNQQYTHEILENIIQMFNTEVRSLSLLRHKNIVPILGFSIDGPTPCIVCEYIDGGSLKQKIADKVLNESQRITIMIGTAEGLKYIHNAVKPNPNPLPTAKNLKFTHRDVKSANILLTKDYLPKLCDFGLAKQFDKTFKTEIIKGTKPYMAPESFAGTYTQKTDVYSYGIVLLELLTGLEAIVTDSEVMNIKDYMHENSVSGDITHLLDKTVDRWVNGQSIYGIAKLCLNFEITQRPSMDEICRELQVIQNNN